MKRVVYICLVLILTQLVGCGDTTSSSPTPPQPSQDYWMGDLSSEVFNFSSYPLKYTISCVSHCAPFSANANLSASKDLSASSNSVILHQATVPPMMDGNFQPFSIQYPGLQLNVNYQLQISYDNGHGCKDVIKKTTSENSVGEDDLADFLVVCGTPPTHASAEMGDEEGLLPAGSQVTVKFTPKQKPSLLSSDDQSKRVVLNDNNGYSDEVRLPSSHTYQVSATQLLSSCDCYANSPSTYSPSSALSGLNNFYTVKYQYASQRLVYNDALVSPFDWTTLLNKMQAGGYNVMLFSGLHLQTSESGASSLVTKSGSVVSQLLGSLDGNHVPQYLHPVLVINQTDTSKADLKSLMAALQPFNTQAGIAISVKDASTDVAHLTDLIQTLQKNNWNKIIVLVSDQASSDDLKAIATLKSVLDNGNWNGWVQATQSQLDAIQQASQPFKPQQLIVDMSGVSSKTEPMSKLLQQYQAASAGVNGVFIDDSSYSADDINALRQAIFLNTYPNGVDK